MFKVNIAVELYFKKSWKKGNIKFEKYNFKKENKEASYRFGEIQRNTREIQRNT